MDVVVERVSPLAPKLLFRLTMLEYCGAHGRLPAIVTYMSSVEATDQTDMCVEVIFAS